MIDSLLFAVTLFAALGCGLVGGIFFAFSSFVMRALARLPAAAGIAAMQSVNVAVLNPAFMILFLGTAAASLLLVAGALVRWHSPGSPLLLAGAALYLVGVFVVTAAFNVPRNDRLGRVDPSDPAALAVWSGYLRDWTRWNHVRTIGALAAAMALTLALARPGAVPP